MKSAKSRRSGKQCVMAMVLGLAAMGSSAADARGAELAGQSIQDISRYCTVCWRNARLPVDRWGDCTQEVFRRLLERVPAAGWSQVLAKDSKQRRELVRAIDAVKKQTQRERRINSYLDETDARQQAEQQRHEDREVLHRAADALLSPRQQRILRLTSEGWSIAEIAVELATPCERVSDDKYKAIQKLRQHFEENAELRIAI